MAYVQKQPAYISADDYLLIEERSATKHEYLGGVIYDWQGGVPSAVAGGTMDHNQVSANIYVSLRRQLESRPCRVFIADVRVAKADESAFFYPDVVVTCSAADQAGRLQVREPAVVVEVLSPSTELFDRVDKFKIYRSFDSLQTYVLVSPERGSIEVFNRQKQWVVPVDGQHERLTGSRVVELGTLGLTLLAADVFEGV